MEVAYRARAGLLLNRARRELGREGDSLLPPIDFVKWAIARRCELRPASWRAYKAAIRFWLNERVPADAAALEALEQAGGMECLKKSNRTSSRKARRILGPDLRRIREFLFNSRGKWARPTAIWLTIGIVTGLRPSEWRSAKLDIAAKLLIVRNAKNSNGRANGERRTLDLSGFPETVWELVRSHVRFVGEFQSEQQFRRVYRACAKTLYLANAAIWPRRRTSRRKKNVTLYSARHQFSANAKKGGATRAEVAALMGHGSDATAVRHYGRRRSGTKAFIPRPNEAEVEQVRRKEVSRQERKVIKEKEKKSALTRM